MPQEAFQVHGLGDDFLRDKPVFAEIADAFLTFVGDAKLVIHNASFDMGFINMELRRLGKTPLPTDQAIDTLDIARRKFPGAQASLDALCKRFGVDNSNRTLHGALLDSEILAEVYLELLGGRQQGMALEAASRKGSGDAVATDWTPPPRSRALQPLITDEERAAHEAFVAELGEAALWNA
jgi:DNA polymerase-3 subunit epsilon